MPFLCCLVFVVIVVLCWMGQLVLPSNNPVGESREYPSTVCFVLFARCSFATVGIGTTKIMGTNLTIQTGFFSDWLVCICGKDLIMADGLQVAGACCVGYTYLFSY